MKDPYKNIASWYDRIFEPLNIGLRIIGMKMYPPEAGMDVLDIGCGTGAHLRLYQKENCNIYGIDLSASMLDVARRKLGNAADLRLCNAAESGFSDNKFDLILCSTALHEMPQPVRIDVLSEAKRILKSEGKILLIDFNPGPIINLKGAYSKIRISISEVLAGVEHFRNYRNFMKIGGLPYLIKSAGLQIENQKIVGSGNFGIFLLKK